MTQVQRHRRALAAVAVATTILALGMTAATTTAASAADDAPAITMTPSSGPASDYGSDRSSARREMAWSAAFTCPAVDGTHPFSVVEAFVSEVGEETPPVAGLGLIPVPPYLAVSATGIAYTYDPTTGTGTVGAGTVVGSASVPIQSSAWQMDDAGTDQKSLAQILQPNHTYSIGLYCYDENFNIIPDTTGHIAAIWDTLTTDANLGWTITAATGTNPPPPAAVATSTAITASLSANDQTAADLTATVTAASGSDVPGGTVQFADAGTNVGSPVTVDASGHAQYTATGLAPGDHTFTATFTPADPTAFTGSTSPASSTVTIASPPGKTDTQLAAVVVPTGIGRVDLAAVVGVDNGPAEDATGTVQFFADGEQKGEAPVDKGTAAFEVTGLTPGQTYSFSAKYSGDDTYNPSQSPSSQLALPLELKDGVEAIEGETYGVEAPAGTFAAGETVKAEIHSDPITLEDGAALADGSAFYTFVMPDSVPAGSHELVLTGATSGTTKTVAFTIASSGGGVEAGGSNTPVSFATDWVARSASTPLGLAWLVGMGLAIAGVLAGGTVFIVRRRNAQRSDA